MICPATPLYDIGIFSMSAREGEWKLKCDALSHNRQRQLMLVSCAGPHTVIKALAAGLSTGNAKFTIETESKYVPNLERHPEGYICRKARLGLNVWHIVAMSKSPDLLPVADEASLWQKLRDSRFTTPLLREWMPFVLEDLERREGLVKLGAWQCEPALLSCDNALLDECVVEGIKSGAISV